jgi:2,4-dienoyl-CoA reductase-like NADH-dependent reductase (Old Yellow Enzyme family)
MAPMTRSQSPQNIPTREVSKYYRRRAEGGAGLIITECTFIDHPAANCFTNAPAFHGEEALSAWAHVVGEVHKVGGKIMPQIWHAGPSHKREAGSNKNISSIGPMDLFKNTRQIVKGMSKHDIQAVISAFSKAASNAKIIGFDGIEIHGAHGYLIDQFLWHRGNQRTDEYGGSLENRVRFACEIVESVRDAVGTEFPICFRFSQWKLNDYNARIAYDARELERLLIPLVRAGVDLFHVSTRRFWQPAFSDSELSLAGWTKKITRRPVIAVGSVGINEPFSLDIFSNDVRLKAKSIDLVEDKLTNGEFDLVAVGRAILADANWPNKIRSGQLDKIAPFTSEYLATLN